MSNIIADEWENLTDSEIKALVKKEMAELYGDSVANDVVDEEDKKRVDAEVVEILKTAEFNLDTALDTFDPTFPGYIPSADAFEFYNLMRLVNGEDFEFNTPIAHYFMADLLLGHIKDVNQFPYSPEVCATISLDALRIGFMCSRGLAKSTVVISFFSVYSAIKGELPNGIGKVWFYLVLAASSRGGARVNALAVRAMCEDSVFLNEYFEEMRFTEMESEFIRKGKQSRKNRGFLIRYQGINTGVRGSRYGERRICCIIFDDAILNTAAAYSKVMSETLDEIIHSDSTNALKGGGMGRVVLCFTPFHYGDVNTKALLNGAFTQCVIPMARMFDAERDNLTARDVESSWEAMHPASSVASLVRNAKKAKKLKAFMQERMLRLTSGTDRLVPDSCIQWCDMSLVEKNIDAYNVYITTDYTTTSGEGSDYSGRATWAVNSNEDWFLLDIRLRKQGMDAQYKDTLREANKWLRRGKHVEIGVEVDGNQSAHIYSLEKMMLETSTWATFARQKGSEDSGRKGILSRSTGMKKHERFRIAASSVLLTKKMWFPEHLKDSPDMQEMLSQIKGATHEQFTRSDDGPDLISMAIVSMRVNYPSASITAFGEDVEVSSGIWSDPHEDTANDYGGSTIF